MLMQFCLTAKNFSKKGAIADFFSIIAFALIIIIFYFLFKFTLGKTIFELPVQSTNVQDTISLLSILRTPVEVDQSQISAAELIALSKIDPTKTNLLEKHLMKIMDDSFGTSSCAMACIDKTKIKGSGCRSLELYICSDNTIPIPGYDNKPISVSLQSSIEQPKTRQVPLK